MFPLINMTFSCDGCNKTAHVSLRPDGNQENPHHTLPQGWLRWTQGYDRCLDASPYGREVPWVACSEKCVATVKELIKGLKQRAAALQVEQELAAIAFVLGPVGE